MEPNTQYDNQTQSSIFEDLNDLQQYELRQGIKKIRNILFGVGGILFVFDMIYLLFLRVNAAAFLYVFIVDLLILGAYIGLGFLASKKPVLAALGGLLIFVGIQVVTAIVSGSWTDVFSAFIMKIIIIAMLVKALIDARKLQELVDRERRLNR